MTYCSVCKWKVEDGLDVTDLNNFWISPVSVMIIFRNFINCYNIKVPLYIFKIKQACLSSTDHNTSYSFLLMIYLPFYLVISHNSLHCHSGAHSLNVRSYEHVAMNCESGEMSMHITLPSCPDNVFSGCHVLLDHTFAVLSYDDVTTKLPP